jgi:hypothetical protein
MDAPPIQYARTEDGGQILVTDTVRNLVASKDDRFADADTALQTQGDSTAEFLRVAQAFAGPTGLGCEPSGEAIWTP